MSKTATADQTNSNNKHTHVSPSHYLMWFRRDLRVHDNTALTALCEQADKGNAQVSALFFLTPEQWHSHDMSLAQMDHIARTLPILAQTLQTQLNIKLTVQVAPHFSDCIDALNTFCTANNITCLMANHEYEGNEIARDEEVKKQLEDHDIEFVRWHDQCVLPPNSITTNDDSMYQVFTPFYKKWRHTLDVSTIQIHEAPKVKDNKVNLNLSENSANTVQ